MRQRPVDEEVPKYVWVKRAHPVYCAVESILLILWIFTASPIGFLIWGGACLVGLFLGISVPFGRGVEVQCLLFLAFLVTTETAKYIMFCCSRCGYNPARGAKGKWLGLRALNSRLEKLTECPICHAVD